jgi:anti-anti-sigma factor
MTDLLSSTTFRDDTPEFSVRVVDVPPQGTYRVSVTGELDLPALEQLTETVDELGRLPRCRRILLDLQAITFLGACGVSWLVYAQHSLHTTGRRLDLTGTTDFQRRLLRVASFPSASAEPLLASEE